MIQIAEVLHPPASRLWQLVKQCGVNHAVGTPGPQVLSSGAKASPWWHWEPLAAMKEAFDLAEIELSVIEARPPLEKTKLGIQGRDEEIDEICRLIRNMGKLGIPVWCPEWMVTSWIRTSTTTTGRGGALVTSFDHDAIKNEPLTELGEISEESLWENLKYFLECIVPVAEESNVKLAMHPDDPPLSPICGIGRIMRSIDNFQRLIDLVPSPVNGICMCQGNFTLMTDDLPEAIRHFGNQDKIFFVHFRDVEGTPEKYCETFHDEGPTDMRACLEAYKEIGFNGVLRPDHVPTMAGESNQNAGYEVLGRLFAIGYIRGLQESVYGK